MKVRLSEGSKYLGAKYASVGGIGMSIGADLAMRTLIGKEKLNLKTIGKSAVMGTVYAVTAPWLMWGSMGLNLAAGAIGGLNNTVKVNEAKNKMRNDTGMRATYQDTQQAATMRQAAIQAIQGSKLNARNALGGEAAMMHRRWVR